MRHALILACLAGLLAAPGVAVAAPGAQPVPVPAAGHAVKTSHPSRVVGNGTPASCTSAAVVTAVRAGGIIRFDCGPQPVTITMRATAKVRNTSRQVVLDGEAMPADAARHIRRLRSHPAGRFADRLYREERWARRNGA